MLGGFWFAFAATMIPAFNAAGVCPRNLITICVLNTRIAPYSASTTDTVTGLSSAGFMNTYGKPAISSLTMVWQSTDSTSFL
jgi:hypothetical protein